MASRGRKASTAELTTLNGEVCDSLYERLVLDDLTRRGVEYWFHPGPYEYHRPVRGGFCLDCDSNSVRKGALYTPDLYLPGPQILIELKGGSTTKESRGRLVDYCKTEGNVLYFMFRDNRPILSGSKTTHRKWAERLGCIVHIGMTVPESWLE